jgi:hypothetical protein
MAETVQYKWRSTMYANTNPEYREKTRKWVKESTARRIAKDPEAFKEMQRNYVNDRYKNDPEFRERKLAISKAYYERKKAQKIQQVP